MEALEVAGITAGLGAMSLAKQLRRIGEDGSFVSQSSKLPDAGDNVDSRDVLKSFLGEMGGPMNPKMQAMQQAMKVAKEKGIKPKDALKSLKGKV